jgi:hypothetical protein
VLAVIRGESTGVREAPPAGDFTGTVTLIEMCSGAVGFEPV